MSQDGLKQALGADATPILKELRDRDILECEDGKLVKRPPKSFCVKSRMRKIVLAKRLVKM